MNTPRTPNLGAASVIALGIAFLIPAFCLWQGLQTRSAVLATARQNVQTLSHALAEQAQGTVDGVDAILSMTIGQIRAGAAPEALRRLLGSQSERLLGSHGVAVADALGVVAADTRSSGPPLSVADRPYFVWHRDHDDEGLHASALVVSRLDGLPAIPLSRRVTMTDGTFGGVVVDALRPDDFQRFFDELRIGPHGAVGLWTSDGQLLVRRPRVVGQGGATEPVRSRVPEKFGALPSGLIERRSPVDGVLRIGAFEHLRGFPLVVSVAFAVDDILADWTRDTAVQACVALMVSMMLLVLALALERGRRAAERAAAEMREVERRYRLLADHAADLVTMRPRTSFRRVYVSPSSTEMTGWTPDEFATLADVDFIHPDDLGIVRGAMATVCEERPRVTIPHRLIRRDGIVVHLETHVTRAALPDGSEALIVTARDVSHLRTAELRATAANRLLEMAEEAAQVGHWRVSLPDEQITWSDEVFRIHGLPTGSAPPPLDQAFERYHPDDRDAVQRAVEEAIVNRGGFEFKLRIVRPDGEVRHVIARGRCEVLEGGSEPSGLVGVFMDVTTSERVQRELVEATEHLRATLDNMDQGLIKVSGAGQVELVNRRFAEILELPPDLLTRSPLDLRDVRRFLADRGEYGPAGEEFEREARDAGTPLTLGVYERARPDGRFLEVRTVAAPHGAVVRTYTDVTARRHAEAALRESEAQYRILADATSDVITRLDLCFRHRYVSPSCVSVLGHAPADLLGREPWEFVHPDDVDDVRSSAERLVKGDFPDDRALTTFRFLHGSGRFVWIEAAINLSRNGDRGRPRALVCSLRDISERQETARQLEVARAAAENAALLKGEFVANMSHELRTPLTGILGVHDLLEADPTLSATQRRHLRLARDAGRSLLAIVNDVLDFSKIEAGQLAIEQAPFVLHSLVSECKALVEDGAATKGVQVRTRLGSAVTLVGDAGRLRQVLLNLLTNAVKFTHAGSVTIEADYDRRRGTLNLIVSDTGIGIPADKQAALFERFSQADSSITRRYGGTGLGLAICKRLVDLMGGSIDVESAPELGSTFRVRVPLELAETSGAAASVDLGAKDASPRRILLAEDNLTNQEIVRAMLEGRGHRVTVVDDGAAAVAAAFGRPGFDLLLMDMQMPRMDGLTATAAIRAAEVAAGSRRVPIIGFTANAMPDDVARCLAAGMDGHLAKPIDWDALFTAVETFGSDAAPEASTKPDASLSVVNVKTLDVLVGYIGSEVVEAMLMDFSAELEARIAGVDVADLSELAERCHYLLSISGQLGFEELSWVCRDTETQIRSGAASLDLDRLRGAADRALTAARSGSLVKAQHVRVGAGGR